MKLELCTMTHNELNTLAVKWLKRPASGNGPVCQLALTEVGGLYGGERADAFGYRWGFDGGSVVVESKVIRRKPSNWCAAHIENVPAWLPRYIGSTKRSNSTGSTAGGCIPTNRNTES